MAFLGDIPVGESLTFSAATTNPVSKNKVDADAPPQYRIYEEEDDPPLLTGTMALHDSDDTEGFYLETVVCSEGNGFEAGKSYNIFKWGDVTVDGTTYEGSSTDTFRVIEAAETITVKVEPTILRSETRSSMNKILVRTYVNGVLADMDGVELQDSADAYGMKETVSGDSLIAAGTSFTKTDTGKYEIDFGSEAAYDPELAYTYAIEITKGTIVEYLDAQSIAAIAGISADACVVYGYVGDGTGQAKESVTVKAQVLRPPQAVASGSDTMHLSADEETTTTNASGYWSFSLPQGALVRIQCEDTSLDKHIEVPAEATKDIGDISDIG